MRRIVAQWILAGEEDLLPREAFCSAKGRCFIINQCEESFFVRSAFGVVNSCLAFTYH